MELPSNISCPECHRQPVECTVPTQRGAYCRCLNCGYIWHEDGALVEASSEPFRRPNRRKADPV